MDSSFNTSVVSYLCLTMRITLLSWLFLAPIICSFSLGFSVEATTTSVQCLSHQRSLLVHLKNSLKFDHFTSVKLVKWNHQSNSDCCTWDGVACDKGCVVGLNLASEGILGWTDDSLFGLQHLVRLDLSHNQFGSSIPQGIGKLGKLTYLNLSNAGFVGPIPFEMSHLRSLVILDLSSKHDSKLGNDLKVENLNFNVLVQNFSAVEELYLDGVNIRAHGSEWCQALSSSLPSLRVLSLSDCNLSGPFDQSLLKLQNLSVFRLDNNNLASHVPPFFANFSDLGVLSLRSCHLYGRFPREIFHVLSLQTLDISGNSLLWGTLPKFHQNSSLQILELNATNFWGKIPTSINKLQNLSKLNLRDCQFNGTLPNSLSKLPQLVYLDLSFNDFKGPIPYFSMSNSLTDLLLSHNGFTGEISLVHWEGLSNLVHVDLKYNFLNGSIPMALFAISSLEEIMLSNNNFSGAIVEFNISSSSSLHTLDLSSNNLEGNFPTSIFQLKSLSFLHLSHNKFNGTILLDMFQGLGKLVSLDLSSNNWSLNENKNTFMNYFPYLTSLALASCNLTSFPYLKNHSKLINLDLSDNHISGPVPKWIWELGNGNLKRLNLSCNHLTGTLKPYSLPQSLKVLDLHLNQLQGKIPILPYSAICIDFSSNNFSSSISASIGARLSSLLFFSLSNNHMSGGIPKSLCNSRFIQVLDLSNNSLSGRIPKCIYAMSRSLVVLNLRRNNFTGPIPDVFPVNCSLRTLQLNGNSIKGQIPESLANCTKIEVLDLGNNNLYGNFPCLLKNISNLRVLVLRSNQFYGTIICPDISAIWAMLQIIDLAHNRFDGRLPRESLANWPKMTVEKDDAQAKLDHLQFKFARFSSSFYYQDVVTVTTKGLEMELQKILTVFTSIDLSSNNFVGLIPEQLGHFRSLYFLNVSNNALTGQIPSFIGNLPQLESLDLSRNNLNGTIPSSLQSLTFLSLLNLSFNQLVGQIPKGNQFETFTADSYMGNDGLCGFPLEKNCTEEVADGMPLPNTSNDSYSDSGNGIDWNFIAVEIGFIAGFFIVVGPLVFFKRWRRLYFECIDDIGVRIVPRLYIKSVGKKRRQKRRR